VGARQYIRFLGPAIRAARFGMLRRAVLSGDAAGQGNVNPILRAAWAPGISVIIPERDTPDLLERALDHLQPALANIAEPSEVIVVVNGASPDRYSDLMARFPAMNWQLHARPLGFSGALAQGLAAARFGGVYLHNSDMTIEQDALIQLLPWRTPQVFAIASQIFFDDPKKRREETGWGDMRMVGAGRSEMFERMPEDNGLVRSGLYASGGSSLFDAALLRRFSALTQGYAPFYYEDADWGAQAWRNGLEVLFQPNSIAWHRHRGTISRLYSPAEIERIVSRNAILFDLRNLRETLPVRLDAKASPWPTLKELADKDRRGELREIRVATRAAAFGSIDLTRTTDRIYSRPAIRDGRPLILLVVPFNILPPRHGGARRIWHLCVALKDQFRFMLLSDEGGSYDVISAANISPFESVHLIAGRPNGAMGRIDRIRTHSHARLQAELDYLVQIHQPDIVQIEHIELSGLKAPRGIPTLLTLHDVMTGTDGDAAADDFEREKLARFHAVVACSREDIDALAPFPAFLVPNGADVDRPYRPSTGNHGILFAGPFRYRPNLDGLSAFLNEVFPQLRRDFPGLTLTVLGGKGGKALAAGEAWMHAQDIKIIDAVDDVSPWLDDCALTVNPLTATRGSSIKLIESLAAGRVCVSTRDGARGFVDAGLAGLLVANDIAGMLEPIRRMLADEAERVALEAPRPDMLRTFSWDHAAAAQGEIYRSILSNRAEAA
jgi:GT2 family glycosyltransferase